MDAKINALLTLLREIRDVEPDGDEGSIEIEIEGGDRGDSMQKTPPSAEQLDEMEDPIINYNPKKQEELEKAKAVFRNFKAAR